jgi:hypothetical protein
VARAVGGSDVGASSTTQPDNPSAPSSRAHPSPPQPPSASGGGRLASTLVLGRETWGFSGRRQCPPWSTMVLVVAHRPGWRNSGWCGGDGVDALLWGGVVADGGEMPSQI